MPKWVINGTTPGTARGDHGDKHDVIAVVGGPAHIRMQYQVS